MDKRAVWKNRLMLAGLWLVFYGSVTLWLPPLLDDADSVHAEVAREMLVRHDWVTLYANGIRYLEKAPLFYWMMALSMKVFGATVAASRVPLALAMAALTGLLEAFARRVYGVRAGWYAGVITLSSFGIFIFSRINIPDVLVCVFLAAALYCYVRAEDQKVPRPGWSCGFGVALALTVLTKGLIGVVFPVAIVGVHLLAVHGARRGWARLRTMHLPAGLSVFLALAAPWHGLAAWANPGHGVPGGLTHVAGGWLGHWVVPLPTDGNVHGWAWFYFVNEQVYRYLDVRVPHDYDTVPLWLFYAWVPLMLLPWAGFLVAAVRAGWPRDLGTRTAQINLLLLVWAVVPLLFFLLSTRQEYYVLPSIPPLILLVARLLSEGEQTAVLLRRSLAGMAGVGALVGIVCMVLALASRVPAAGTDLASLLKQNPGEYALSFGHFLDLNRRALGMFRFPLLYGAVAFGVGLPLAYLRVRKAVASAYDVRIALRLVSFAAFLFVVAAWRGLLVFAPVLSSAALAETMRGQVRAGDLVAIHGEYEAGSTLGFYLRRDDLHIVEGRSSNLWYGSFFPDAPKIFETRESIAARWAGAQRVFLWEDPQDKERPALALPGTVYVVAAGGGKRVVSNQANR